MWLRVSGANAVNGADYVAAVRLSAADDTTLAEPGDTCDRVPAVSLPWLLEQGLIAEASRR
jgi:hypothetical protein